jgi:hypothetical protein
MENRNQSLKDGFLQVIGKTYVRYLLIAVVLLISIKPAIFTWNMIMANYHLHQPGHHAKAQPAVYRSLDYNPSSYKAFKKYHRETVEHLVIKSVIYQNDITLPVQLGMPKQDFSRLKKTLYDNFYFQDLIGNLHTGTDSNRKWQNLDEVSFQLLADKTMNQRTIAIFKKIGSTFDREFIENLADFCFWKKNKELYAYLMSTYNIHPPKNKWIHSGLLAGTEYTESVRRLKEVMTANYNLADNGIGKNLLEYPGIEFTKSAYRKLFEENWTFADMAGTTPYADGSFTIGMDNKNGNGMLRIMGFWTDSARGKHRPRGGVWSKKRFAIDKGYYLFSFDYLTKTGKEKPSFYLTKGIRRVILPPANGKWKKVIFILNNSTAKHRLLKPLVRIWGTGSMWLDNVFLAKITDPVFTIPTPKRLWIEDEQNK